MADVSNLKINERSNVKRLKLRKSLKSEIKIDIKSKLIYIKGQI